MITSSSDPVTLIVSPTWKSVVNVVLLPVTTLEVVVVTVPVNAAV